MNDDSALPSSEAGATAGPAPVRTLAGAPAVSTTAPAQPVHVPDPAPAAPPVAGPAGPGPAPAARTPQQDCPQCGRPTPADPRFAVWCAACGWNADPTPPEPPRGRLRARARKIAARRGEDLHAELLAHAEEGVAAPALDVRGVAAYALAWAVHLSTLAIAAAGLLLVVLGWGVIPQVVLGAVLLLIAYGLRPRFGRLPAGAVTLDRAGAPHLYRLLDRVAAEAGTRTADIVTLSPAVNAGVLEYGARRRRRLELGLPLWHMLTPQQRVAVLGHEFGHYANGDTRQTLVVGGALRSLVAWYDMLRPGPLRSRGPIEAIARAVMHLPRGVVLLLIRLLDRLTLHASRRAEYRADGLAARVASSEAAGQAFDLLLAGDSVRLELRRQAILARTGNRGATARTVADGLWQRLARHAATIPGHERERLRRVSALRGHSAWDTHPPTHLRCALIAAGPPLPAAVTLDDAEAAAIDAELATPAARLAKATLRDIPL